MIPAALLQTVRLLEDRTRRVTRSTDAMCVFVDAIGAWTIDHAGAPRPVPAQAWPVVSQVAATGQRAFLGRALVEPIGAGPVCAVVVLRRPPSAGLYGAHEVAAIRAITTDVAAELACLLPIVRSRAIEDGDIERTSLVASVREEPLEPVLFGIALRIAIFVTALVIVLSLYRLTQHLT